MTGTPPRLAPGTPMQKKAPDDLRTVTRTEPHQPVSKWHRAAWWLRHHMNRTAEGEWKDESGWGPRRRTPAKAPRAGRGTREERRADLRLAQHAQDLRAEAASGGNKRELRAFYGSQNESAVGPSERRVRTTAAERDEAAYRRQVESEHWYFRDRKKKKGKGK